MADIEIREGLIVQPGDTLIIRIDPEDVASSEDFDAFVQRVRLAAEADGYKVRVVAAREIGAVRTGEP